MSDMGGFRLDDAHKERGIVEERRPSSEEGERPRPADDFVVNYFNYFTEVEEHFARRRGKHLMLSTLDWAAIESWKDMGIPLHVVLRAIDRVFDAYEARPGKTRRINSILYCQQEVMACFAEYQHARIGAREDSDGTTRAGQAVPFSREMVLEYLEHQRADLQRVAQKHADPEFAPLREAIERVIPRLDALCEDVRVAQDVNFETLERELVRLEEILYEALVACLPEEYLEAIRQEGIAQLKEHKKRMSGEVYQHTLTHYIKKRVRQEHALPRLSLFYL